MIRATETLRKNRNGNGGMRYAMLEEKEGTSIWVLKKRKGTLVMVKSSTNLPVRNVSAASIARKNLGMDKADVPETVYMTPRFIPMAG